MKKIVFLMIVSFAFVILVHAQKQSGVVYSEHDGITKTKTMWAAFVKGDKETFLSFFADSVRVGHNGKINMQSRGALGGGVDWWKDVANFSVSDDSPAFPDAIQYKGEGFWVQDWLRVTGTHKKTGINIDWPLHNLYHFNKAGKIDGLHQYYNDKIFTEIDNSSRTIENGTVYINHPYIVTVRKLMNAWCAENLDSLAKFYSPKAFFFELPFKQSKFIGLDESLKETRDVFDKYDNLKMVQTGYPDCIYYSKDDNYAVYSWWVLSYTTKDGRKKSEIPVMMTHWFDKDGKISAEFVYLSSNHFE